MENAKTIVSYSISAFTSLVSYWLGGYDTMLMVICSLMVLDLIAGIVGAVYKKELNLDKSFRGVIKKFFEFILIALGTMIDTATGNTFMRAVACMYVFAHEGISVLRNLGEFIEYPQFILDYLEGLVSKSDKGEIE